MAIDMKVTISVLDQMLRLRTGDGVSTGGLQHVLAGAADGTLIDLPGMRSDQRAPVVTTLAVLMHLARRYEPIAPIGADAWRDALVSQFDGSALVLAGGPDDAPAFLQPVLLGLGDIKPISITEVDHLMPATRHVLKVQDQASCEEAFYALLCSTWRPYGGRDSYGGARARLLTVLVGDGSTLASEVISLADSYARMKPSIVGTEAATPHRALDHMLWAHPWVDNEPPARLPYPFIDCRRIRFTRTQEGKVGAITVTSKAARTDTELGDLEDPHVPVQSNGSPYKIVKKRRWTHLVQHEAVVGSGTIRRPRILDLAPPYSFIRISAIGYDQGVTKGYWEALYRFAKGQPHRLARAAQGDRLSNLSMRALATVKEAVRVLYAPLLALSPGYDVPAKRAVDNLRTLVGPRSLQVILEIVADEPDTAREQQELHAMAAQGVRRVWANSTRTVAAPFRVAQASLWLNERLLQAFQESLMPEMDTDDLSRRTHAVLFTMDGRLTPDNRARIRSSATALPFDAYVALAAAPAPETDAPQSRRVWEAAVRALATVRQGGPQVGSVLVRTGYPEARVSTLLVATGDTLLGLIDEAVRWLATHDVRRATLTDLIVLGLADSSGDRVVKGNAVSRFALACARASSTQQRKSA